MFKVNNTNTKTTSMKPFSTASIVDFEQVNASLAVTILKRETPTQVFSYEICKIFKCTYFEKYLRTTASVYLLKEKIPKGILAKSLAVYTIKATVFSYDSENLPAFPLRERCLCQQFFWYVFSRTRTEYSSKCGNIRTRKTPNKGTFHAVFGSIHLHMTCLSSCVTRLFFLILVCSHISLEYTINDLLKNLLRQTFGLIL